VSLAATIRTLVEAEIRFVVIGGIAAVAHGSTRITLDLDLCYDAASDNLTALACVLAGWNAYPREVEPGLPFMMDARTLRSAGILTLSTDVGPLDVIRTVQGVGGYEECKARSEEVEVEGIRFSVLDLAALIDAKRAAGRPRDMEHLKELEAILELRDEGA